MPLSPVCKIRNYGGKILAIYLVLVFCPAAAAQISHEETAAFEKANEAYRDGKYQQAAELYQNLITANPNSAVFYYNLGNANYRLKKIGPAILAFERALMRSPRQNDIRSNLNYVRSRLEYVIEDKRNWYVKTGEVVLSFFREDEINVLFLFSLFIFLCSWIFCRYKRNGAAWGWVRKGLLLIVITFGVLTGLKIVQVHVIRSAIVTAQEAEVRYGPSIQDQVAFRLGEGLKISVIDVRNSWSRVWLVNGKSGWMKNSHIERVYKRGS